MLGGLRVPKPDDHDIKVGNIFRLPALSELPEEFLIDEFPVLDQKNSDFCSGFTTIEMSQPQEGVRLSPLFSFMASKILSGDPAEWGQDPRQACRAHTKIGALEESVSPFKVDNFDEDIVRFQANWPDLESLKFMAEKHKKDSYARVSGQYDYFDDIRATIWYFAQKNDKRVIGIGMDWVYSINDPFIEKLLPPESGTGHMVSIIGFTKKNDKDWLVIKNSYGELVGDKGKFYLSGEIINASVAKYGAWMFIDLPKEQAKIMNKWPLAARFPWIAKVLSWFY